jgi:hypothetical protein
MTDRQKLFKYGILGLFGVSIPYAGYRMREINKILGTELIDAAEKMFEEE